MKKQIQILCMTALFAATAHSATWNDAYGIGNPGSEDSKFSSAGVPFTVITSVQSNSTYIITSAKGSPYGGPVVIDDVSLKSDANVNSTVKFMVATNTWSISSNAVAGATTFWLTATNSQMASNDICVLQDVANDCYQLIVISGNATDYAGTILTNALGEVQVKTFNTITNALTSGDKLYKMTALFSINPYGIATVTNSALFSSAGTQACVGQWIPLSVSGLGSLDRLKFRGRSGSPTAIVLTHSNSTGGGLLVSGEYIKWRRQ